MRTDLTNPRARQARTTCNATWPARLALATLLTAMASAQTRPVVPPQTPPKPPPQQTKPTFTTTIDLVSVALRVMGPKGEFLPDITKDEFIVLEDGVEQKIDSMIIDVGGRHINVSAPVSAAAPSGLIVPAPRPKADTSGRVWVLFIDDANMQFMDTPRMRDNLTRVAHQLVHEGDQFCMVSTGPSSIAVDMSYDYKRIAEEIKKVSGNGMTPQDIISALDTSQGPAGLRFQADTAFRTAYDLLRNLAQLPDKRKSFIWVSSGYDFNPFLASRDQYLEDLYGIPNRSGTDASGSGGTATSSRPPSDAMTSENPFMRQQQTFSEADLIHELAELTRAANAANVVFYTLDPRGLTAGPDLGDRYADIRDYMDYMRNTKDSLKTLASGTGGIAIVDRNNIDADLKRIDNETSDNYLIRYYSSNPDPLKRIRKIEVQVKRPGAKIVQTTKQYILPRPPKIK